MNATHGAGQLEISGYAKCGQSSAVVASNEVFELAIKYARNFPGRALYRLDELKRVRSDAVFVIGLSTIFSRQTLNLLLGSNRLRTIGVATARNSDELSLFLDLQLRIPRPAQLDYRARLLDELYDRTLTLQVREQSVERSPYPARELMEAVTGLDLLGLHVHGEGAHANLRHLVLCGHALTGDPDDSCSPFHCKRAKRAHEGMVSFAEISANTVLLLSCSGFSVSREHYPSTNSSVLSLVAGGKVRTVLCNDRTVPLSRDEVSLALCVAIENGPVAAARFLNDVATLRSPGIRPWFIVGDPAAAGVGAGIKLVLEKAIPPSTASRRHPSVFQVDNAGRSIARMSNGVVVEAGPSALSFKEIGRTLEGQRTRLEHCAQFSIAVDLLLDVLDESDDCDEARLAKLRSGTAAVRKSLLRVSHMLWSAMDSGVVSSGREAVILDRVEQLLIRYARSVAQTLIPRLDEHVDEMVSRLGRLSRAGGGRACPRCLSAMTRRAGVAWACRSIAITADNCVTCGPRRVTVGVDPKPAISALTSWNGEDIPATARVVDSDTWLGLSLKDKATGVNLFQIGPCLGRIPAIKSQSEPRSHPSADLHSLRILAVGPTGLSIDRIRVDVPPSIGR